MILRVSQEAADVTRRFFEAINFLKKSKSTSLLRFSKRYGINYWNITTLKNEPDKRFLKVDYMIYLCRDYGVSPKWLLLGQGEMFCNTTSQQEGE